MLVIREKQLEPHLTPVSKLHSKRMTESSKANLWGKNQTGNKTGYLLVLRKNDNQPRNQKTTLWLFHYDDVHDDCNNIPLLINILKDIRKTFK